MIHLGLTLKQMARLLMGGVTEPEAHGALCIEPFSLLKDVPVHLLREDIKRRLHVPLDSIIDIYPMSPMQVALIASSAKSPGSYTNRITFQLPQSVDLDRLEEAVRQTVAHQEILRTAFVADADGIPVQVVLRDGPLIQRNPPDTKDFLDKHQIPQLHLPPVFYLDKTKACVYLHVIIHHAAMDAASINMLAHDLHHAWSCLPLPERPAYRTFIKQLESVSWKEDSRDAWKAFLDRPPPVQAPIPEILETTEEPGQRIVSVRMPSPTGSDWSSSEILTAAIAVLLRQTSGASSICFGLVLSGRLDNLVGLENVAGPTFTTIPIICDIEPIASKKALLQTMREILQKMRTHQQFGLHNVSGLNDCARKAASFTTLLVIQSESDTRDLGIFDQHTCDALRSTIQYPLEIQCKVSGDAAEIIMAYDGKVVGATEADWLQDHLKHIIENDFRGSEEMMKPLQDSMAMTDGDLTQINVWNSTIIDEEIRPLHTCFSDTASNDPERDAVVFEDTRYTYGELNQLSFTLAHHLVSQGIRPYDRVPLMFDKSAIVIVVILAVLKAGATYVPLDPLQPRARLQAMKDALATDIIVCSPSMQDRCEMWDKRVLVDHSLLLSLLQAPSNHYELEASMNPENTAYIMFTSGSSGTPKGVMISHGAASTSIRDQVSSFKFGPGTRIMHFCSYTFDVSVMEIFATLTSGATLFIPSEQDRTSRLAQYMKENAIQTAILTPTVVRSFLTPERVPQLQQLILVGEPCNQNLISEWCRYVQLINDYGPTETTIDSATNTNITERTKATNVGKPISAHLWIVQRSDPSQLCPLGVAGELLISGPTLAKGYLNDPEKTSQAFIDGSGFSWVQKMAARPSRLYKTGDLARYSRNGEIHILGRIDSQIKLKGLRIEVQEIEHALENFEPSLRAGVVLTKSTSGEDSLFAAVSKESWRSKSQSSTLELTTELGAWIDVLKDHASKLLPGHMRPSIIVPLTQLPTMTSGKLDRWKLRQIAASLVGKWSDIRQCQPQSKTGRTIVLSQAEYDLREQWARTLRADVDGIHPDSNFFAMGGDSLSAMKLSSAFSNDRRLTVKSIFQHPTLRDMAKAVDTVGMNGETASNAAIRPKYQPRMAPSTELFDHVASVCGVRVQEIETVFPCSPLQEGLFAASLLSSGSYSARIAYELSPEVDLGRFCASWEAVFHANPILRTRIVRNNQETAQFLQTTICQQLPWKNVDTEEAADKRYDVALGAELTHWILLNDNGRTRRFALLIHHSLYDDVTLQNIFSDFAHFYTKGFLEAGPRLFGMQQYIGFLESLDENRMIETWRASLNGTCAVPFPPNKRPGYKPLTDRATQILTAKPLGGNSWRSNQTPILRAAWLLTIARHQHAVPGGESVCFGTILSSRTSALPGFEQVLGPLIQSVPVVESVDRTDPLPDFIERIRMKYVQAMDAGHLGLKKIRSIGPEQASACDFNNLFVIQSGETEDDYLPKDRVEGFTRLKQELQHPYGLVLECVSSPIGITFSASYDSAILDELAVSMLLEHFGTAFERITELHENNTAKVSDVLSSLSSDAESSLVCSWNQQPVAPDGLLHERFLAAARKWPGREAAFAHDRSLTYEQLDQESSTLAYKLIDSGVQAGSMIPICFEKSSYMLVAILAVLRAGGAYVPISPDHPPERQLYIIDQCRADLILASKEQTMVISSGLHTSKMVICVDERFFVCGPTEDASPPPMGYTSPSADSVAYILFTSGSTGTPKGVVVSHGAVTLSMVKHAKRFGHAERDGLRCLQYCNYTFDVSIMDIFPALSFGGCVCIPSEADRIGDISSFIRRSRADLAMLTPTIANILDPIEVPSLCTMVVSGEPMTESVRDKWTNPVNVPERVLHNVYGPTEASVNVATLRMTSTSNPSNVGSAILGSQLWIVEPDDSDKLAPLGCVGELIITGPCLADEYLHAAAQTAKAFIEAPPWLPTRFISRAYRTGDLARFAPNGEVEIIGRIDAQVKLHGIRIELGEIEQVACRLDYVKIAVAIVSNKRGRDELFLFYESTHDQYPAIRRSIREQLRRSLPSAFIPTLYIDSTIPMTSTGKIDRKALAHQTQCYRPEELNSFAIDDSDFMKQLPETKKQKEMRTLWSRALGIQEENVWLQTNFFSVGGDSVGVIALVSMMQRSGYSVTYKDVYVRPVLEDMALLLDTADQKYVTVEDPMPFEILAAEPHNRRSLQSHLSSTLSIPADLICDAYPCSAMQTSLIAASMRNPKAYWCTVNMELAPDTNPERLLSSWEAVIRHNPILRTVVVNTKDFANVQVILDADPRNVLGDCYEEGALFKRPLFEYNIDTSNTERMVFQLTMHHVIYDLWVQEALFRQLSQFYNGKDLERYPSFSRFIRFEQQVTQSSEFWRDSMQGASVVKFPNFRIVQNPGEALMTSTVHRVLHVPSRSTSAHSIATIIHCAYALVLSRYGYTSDICYPTVQSGRNIPLQAASDIVGPLMTTSFFRADCSHDRTVSEMLEEASQFLLDAASHQHAAHTVVPRMFNQSIAEMGSMLVVQPRTRSYQSSFDLFSSTATEMAQPGLLLVAATIDDENCITLKLQYAPEAMEQGHAQLFMGHLQRAIEQLAEPQTDAMQSLGNISLITEQDMDIAMQGSGTSMSCADTVLDAMCRVANDNPNAIAINAHDGILTYNELLHQANKLAAVLRSRLQIRAGSEVRIVACSERNAMAVVMQAAIFMVPDAAFVALDPASPVERNLQIVEDSDANIVLFSPSAINLAEHIARGRDVLQVSRETLDELSAGIVCDATDSRPHGDSVAYITYTSGSTGRPKGCIMEHGPLAITILKLTEWKGIDNTVNTLWGSTWSFDVHLSQIWEPLTTGGVICVPSEGEIHKDMEATLTKYNVQHAFFTPTQAKMIDFSKTPSLRSIAMGGESINFSLLPLFKAGLRVFNEYGPSEAAGCVTGHEIVVGDQESNKIGRALFGNCWAVEPGCFSRLAPIGTIGELVAGGTLARGYLDRPEMTRNAFLDSPAWMQGVCSRLYRTGDLVCQDLDGSFRYLGRADTQVKINGVRIEIAEIENTIAKVDPGVSAVVAALNNGNEERSKVLVAFLGDDSHQKSPALMDSAGFENRCANIRGRLAQFLPRTMIPRIWIPLSNAQRTSSGKVDRKVLQAVFEAHKQKLSMEDHTNSKEVFTDAENTVRSLWESVVKCDQSELRKSTNFFDLGDSIAAIGLVAAAARLGYHVSVSSLYKSPGLSEMAVLIQNNASPDSLLIHQDPPAFSLLSHDALETARNHLRRITPSHTIIDDVFSVTPVQEMALVANQRWHRAYMAWFVVEMRGALDYSRLRAACNHLVQVHPLLRTIFFQSEMDFYQAPLENIPIDYQDIPWNDDKSTVPDLIEASCAEDARSRYSPTRFRVLQHTARNGLLALGLSHAQYDGICLPMVFDNLISIYNGKSIAQQPSFSRLVQYSNLQTTVAGAQAFWTKRLLRSSMTNLVKSSNTSRPLLDSLVTAHISVPNSSTTDRRVHTALCLAWAITLGAATGVSDVVFGTLTSGRNAQIQDISSLIGPCITTIPVRVDLGTRHPVDDSKGTTTLGQALDEIHKEHIETLPFEHLGLRKIVKNCTDWPSTTRFSSMVQYQNIDQWDPASNPSWPAEAPVDDTVHWRNRGSIAYKGACDEVDLWVTGVPSGDDRTNLTMLFSEETIPREVAENLMSALTANLEVVLQNAQETVPMLLTESTRRLGGIRLPTGVHQESHGCSQAAVAAVLQASTQETSHSLREVWSQVLGHAPATRYAASDSFYMQGGDSISAAIVSGVAQARGMPLSIQDAAECETFGEQVQRIEQGSCRVARANALEWDRTDRVARSSPT
jgi:amino acid adenylation domain-containing protein